MDTKTDASMEVKPATADAVQVAVESADPSNLKASLEEALQRIAQLETENARLRKSSGADSAVDALVSGLDGHDEHGFLDYLNLSVLQHLKMRMPWLVGLFLLQSFSATIMHSFESLLEVHLVVALFVPMLVGAGGNAGNQPGVIVTRALIKERDVIYANLSRMLRTEGMVALTQGSVLGAIAFFRVLVEFPADPGSALAIAMATAMVVMVSMFLGIFFSIGIDHLNLDPAAGSAPMLTTIADMIGITLLCLSALLILGKEGGAPAFCGKLDRCFAAGVNSTGFHHNDVRLT